MGRQGPPCDPGVGLSDLKTALQVGETPPFDQRRSRGRVRNRQLSLSEPFGAATEK